jgi:hypothetical protein
MEMVNVKVVVCFLGMFSVLFSDELIDDFERGITQNYRNLDWYYFSDVKDGGNSVIMNTEQLSNGSYSKFFPGEDKTTNKKCAVVKYLIGYKQPINGSDIYSNFVGIGTDLASPGHIVDISSASGFSFQARSEMRTQLSFEIVTGNIYNYNYYCKYFEVEKTWKTFTVLFTDKSLEPRNFNWNDHVILDLSKVQKINWIFQIGSCSDSNGYKGSDSGTVYIDNVKLLGNIHVNTTLIPQVIFSGKEQNNTEIYMSDLSGRKIGIENYIPTPGCFVNATLKTKKVFTKTLISHTNSDKN